MKSDKDKILHYLITIFPTAGLLYDKQLKFIPGGQK
jgi:hypothetical protein